MGPSTLGASWLCHRRRLPAAQLCQFLQLLNIGHIFNDEWPQVGDGGHWISVQGLIIDLLVILIVLHLHTN